jgi:SAM-dependent methyltransferase
VGVSRETLLEHRRIWARKPVLAAVYRPWFEELLAGLPPAARVIEIGAGPGFLGAHARAARPDLRYVATDVVAAPGSDVVADALRLPFRDGSLDAVLLLDVIHHLARPWDFFAEAARCLRRGGELRAIEPWITPLSYPIYRFFHQEDCSLGVDPRAPFGTGDKRPFDGDQALPWKLVRAASTTDWEGRGLRAPVVRRLNAFAYAPSLGFRERSLLPMALVAPLHVLDGALQPLAPLFALRASLRWTRP